MFEEVRNKVFLDVVYDSIDINTKGVGFIIRILLLDAEYLNRYLQPNILLVGFL